MQNHKTFSFHPLTHVKAPPFEGEGPKGGVFLVFLLFLFSFLSSFATPQKKWRTEPSPLLLKELLEVAGHDSSGGKIAIRIRSLRERRMEVEWNDTDGIAFRKLIPTFDEDTITASIWVALNDFSAAARLSDSLFAHIDSWYNKERPSVAIAGGLLSRPDAPSGYPERLRYFSRALEGTPYSLGPTGEGRYGAVEPLPLLDLNRFDCVTYIESSVGLALAHKASDVLPAVLSIRYRGDTLGYATRNHFFVGDWLENNPRWFRILRLPGDTVVHKTLFKGRLLSAKGLTPPPVDPVADIPYLPYEKALQLAEHWNLGKRLLGVAFVTGIAGLDVTHTGFVDSESGKPMLRHAGQLKGMVVEQDFKDYLESRRGKCAGVLFFEFLAPASGG